MKLIYNLKNNVSKHKNKKWYRFLEELLCRIKEDEVTAIGGQLTYFLILSIFPFLIFFLNLLSYTSITQKGILSNLLIVLPIETQILLESIINEIMNSSSQTLLSLGIILTIWTGSLGITSIIRAVNKAYNVKKKRPYWRLKGLSILFTIILALLLMLVLTMLVFGEIIGKKIFAYLGATHVFYYIWELLRIIIPFISMILIFALIYKLSPTPEEGLNIKFSQTLPGAIFTTTGWIIASMIFSIYVNNFANYSKTYGSIGGIIVLLLWLYITSIMIVLGGEINGAYASITKGTGVKDCDEEGK
ncbi:membrane protein [Keratinibaculum paraultunense]|uniref:Membrane protein n=1 Tax=Keratinibaculum paraultunense TaxID=1278232 RepID=A0A4R3L0T5_9FIRM|nr:YihY/virulence factor BrkB family protein [Keratinibaculum paraultunense]QQY80061.1 YihY/virulence factor BrkB family protein [Keratinibaculum paraultunense]TCS91618.1 membrane protein [Keratinibaculum paraultunense]